ncbi:tethering complex subunit [Diatrype stigma]|uniref:Tethering complex subunit n=1 Tax=Diatrype stigma TaxID=117547 RepID=A0AAN9YP32_9PEZI
MALNGTSGFNAADELADASLPIFNVESVQLQFSIAADFVAAQVANNVLVLALSNGRILRIDLNRPEDIDDIDLPKRVSEVGVIRRMFLDPTASHLLVCTSLGENYYLHTQSRHPRPLSRLRGVPIESIAWNPSLPTATTREILIGASDGNIYETFIETSNEFYRKEEKYLKSLHKLPDGPITGLWVDNMAGKTDIRRVVITTQNRMFHLVGKVGRVGHEGSGSIYTRLFDGEQPVIHELARGSAVAPSALAISPDPPDSAAHAHEDVLPDRAFAWLSSHGIYHGKLSTIPTTNELGNKVFAESKLLPRPQVVSVDSPGRRKSTSEFIDAIALTQWHIIGLIGDRIVAVNRLTGAPVFSQSALDQGDKALGLYVDQQKNTFWLFTAQKIFEIVVRDEDRDIWRIMLERRQFDVALKYAHTLSQKDAVAIASGDHLAEKGLFVEAAGVYGRSSKQFEDVALTFIDNGQDDALRKYLLTKLTTYKKASIMQRMMIATWLIEVFMAKLNTLEDTITTEADLVENLSSKQSRNQLQAVRDEYRDFVNKHKSDLDRKTTYDVISSHAREDELLFYANAVNDYNYVLSYWVQRERWRETLDVLKKQTDPEVFYRYSSVLMTHVGRELVEIMMRHPKLEPRKIIPALLDYNRTYTGPLPQNQAVRYLQYLINQIQSTDAAVHNTLVSMYAAHPSKDESALLSYLESQGDEPHYDPDFALRLCIQHKRTLSCVHIYTSMGQYPQAVDLALSHGEVELASLIADRPPGPSNRPLRKKLWLKVARQVISPQQQLTDTKSPDGSKSAPDRSIRGAVAFLRRCADPDLLRIEDLIPFFPDFAVIDDFREDVCAQLEGYSRSIETLRRDMDESAATARHIRRDVRRLARRYAVVQPGERCFDCRLPLLSRQFFVFPTCQHAFHSDCLGRRVLEAAGPARARRIRDCQVLISRGLVEGERKEEVVRELDALVAGSCDYAIKRIDEPFIGPEDNKNEWAL